MISIIGTTGTGFLQNDACWRELERLPRGDLRSPFYFRVEVADEPGVLAHIAQRLAEHEVSIARLVQHQREGGATLHVVTHEGRAGAVDAALEEIANLPETQSAPTALPVISSRGVTGTGWT
jgi:homoserine dehydrogenase